ncbi:TetR/AcrR family transcriptional regulator [Dyella lutea]|uniref:TetR/AcrR family transcriptional regulator n=1 Tax=Dyella lutea TaxID=2950441 RepID=A0ABT1FEM9_9GAMM|nr:TetR/AcrR family transcriptional regulator [Dyella lutea]MCP1374672.1 TetR/AcrR family transcriptional regulator [Dyella lutea]
MTAATTPKRALTRELILDHAYELARRDGLEGLTIGSLAADVGMSKSGVFAHFGSREDLLLAVLHTGAERFTEAVMRPALREARGLPRLRAIVRRWFEWSGQHAEGCVLLSAASEYDGRDGAMHDGVVSQQSQWRAALAKAAGQAIEAGHFRADADPEQIAFEIYAVILGLHHDAGLFGFEPASRRADTAFERLWRSWQA